MASGGLLPGTVVLLCITVGIAAFSSCLVCFGAPICAGSGIPEVLSFLNGNSMPGLFSPVGLCIRVVAIVGTQLAGFPVGREGPMVAIGGAVGFGVAWMLVRPQERRFEQVVASPAAGGISLASPTLVVNEERFAHVRRVGCALGGAAGIATAFNAPIGGILYMFEELAVSSLPPELAKFMCTVFSALATRALVQLTETDVHGLIIYDSNTGSGSGDLSTWDWSDIPLITFISAILGCAGAIFSQALLAVWSLRRRTASRFQRYQPWAKIAECMTYCALVTLAWALVPALFRCREIAHAGKGAGGEAHRLLSGGAHADYVRYTCPEGQFNEAATYLLNGAEGAVKRLYQPSGDVLGSGALAVAMFVYFVLACGMPGLAVPMGTFVPSMLTGALAGRLFGENVRLLHSTLHLGGPALAPAGVYAVVGSAAMLAGLTHMTVGIAALLAEAVGNFGLIPPLMLAVLVAHSASSLFSNFGYDEHLIMRKGIPFLDPEVPAEMENEGLVAADICEVLPSEALLPEVATVKAIKRALRQRQVKYFPVIAEGSICIGLTTRGRLRAVLEALSEQTVHVRRPSSDSTCSLCSRPSDSSTVVSGSEGEDFARQVPRFMSSWSNQGYLLDEQAEAKMKSFIRVMFSVQSRNVEDGDDHAVDVHGLVPVVRVMDSAPHSLCEDMPVSRFYKIFNKADAHVAIVVSKRGRFRGILTRASLTSAQAKLHAEGMQRHKEVCSSPVSFLGACPAAGRGAVESGGFPASCSRAQAGKQVGTDPHVTLNGDCTLEQHALNGHGAVEPAATSIDSVAKAVAGNMRPEEMQAELARAWKLVAEAEWERDEFGERLRASDARVRELEFRLYGGPSFWTTETTPKLSRQTSAESAPGLDPASSACRRGAAARLWAALLGAGARTCTPSCMHAQQAL
uniref:Chloride channel protein n=1 Tax=Alexandrium monilatum TaxID=311494 RepID=A0A7S4QBH1_9DINO